MSGFVWLASYPKSGNTWFRMLVANLAAKDGQAVDINKLPERSGIASARGIFDYYTLLPSGLLTHDEIGNLRPHVYKEMAAYKNEYISDTNEEPATGPHFIKVHDAYTLSSSGTPVLAGAHAAIVIVRDPRDVIISLAHHMNKTIDEAIITISRKDSVVSAKRQGQPSQLRQILLSWSDHVKSWLDQQDIPIYLLRYEDLLEDTAGNFFKAMKFAGRTISFEEAATAARLADFKNLQSQEREKGFAERTSKVSLFFREGRAGAWRDVLSPAQIGIVERDHGAVMKRFGYTLTLL